MIIRSEFAAQLEIERKAQACSWIKPAPKRPSTGKRPSVLQRVLRGVRAS
jgi:hypothetical protein